MFRPPPTVVEIGTTEDIRQYEQLVERKSTPVTPPKTAKTVFESPDTKGTATLDSRLFSMNLRPI